MADVITRTIAHIIEQVNVVGRDGRGFTRPSYSALETAAHAVIAREAERLGMVISHDAAQNLYARLPGYDRNATPLYMGSHLDTVPNGGAYDGLAGVAAAMALAASFAENGETPPTDLVVTVTRAEESVWFPSSYIGSRGCLGRLTQADLDVRRVDTNRTLADHMREEGGDPEAALCQPGPSPANFLEVHIEQGPILFDAGEHFAIVAGVRGSLRYRAARILGEWAHSGAAPRNRRSDAVFALADLIVALDGAWEKALEGGDDIAVTVGRIDAASAQHAFAKVPGVVDFCIDFRSADTVVLERFEEILRSEAERIERARGVTFELGEQSRSQPSRMSDRLVSNFVRSADKSGLSLRTMQSGGGHDAAAFAASGWDAAMIFIRNWNGSHNPDEGMDQDDLAAAVHFIRKTWIEAEGATQTHPTAASARY